MQHHWPELSYQKGKATYETLHMWTQIVGKIKLAVNPWINHSWHVTLHVTPTGLSTLNMRYNDVHFQIDFDFFTHQLKVGTSRGEWRELDLKRLSVADFYKEIFSLLESLNINIDIYPVPVEIENPIPFYQDNIHATYDPDEAFTFHTALLYVQDVFMDYRCGITGKCSPIHFFWGSFDLAVSSFSGRRAPKHPGGIPHVPDRVVEEAYSHEVTSCGFWPGSEAFPEAAFYCYLYPEPEGYHTAPIQPREAYYHPELKEFVLPYQAVQQSDEPEKKLMEFLVSTYQRGTELAHWDAVMESS